MTRNERIAELVRSGVAYPVIAERFGVSKSRVGQIAKAFGAARRQVSPLPPAPNPTTLAKLYAAGCTDAEIVRRLKCTKDRVRTWRRKMSLPTHIGRFDKDSVKKAAMMVELGASYTTAAEAFGVTRGAVAGHLNRARSAKFARTESKTRQRVPA